MRGSVFAALLASAMLVACTGQAQNRASPAGTDDNSVRQQIQENWIVDAGMDGLEELVVRIKVAMNPDGSVQSAEIDNATNNGNPNWPIFAESCRRAVLRSSPLQMPREKPYEAWKEMVLVFTGAKIREPLP